MRENVIDLAVQLAFTIVYVLGAIVAGGIGLLIEYHSYLYAAAGEFPLAAWLGLMGTVALAFAYLIITDKLWTAVRGGTDAQ